MVCTVHDIVWVCRAVVVQCRSAHMPVERQFPPDRRTESSSILLQEPFDWQLFEIETIGENTTQH